MKTLHDATRERWASDYSARELREMEKQLTLLGNPHIGTLNRRGKTIYYVTRPEYREANHPITLI